MRILVVGGVAGGLSFAARARRLNEDAEIVVFEKGPHPSFSNCGLPYYVGGEVPFRDDLLLNSRESLYSKFKLDVRLNHEVIALDAAARTLKVSTPDGEISETYDKLVLSPGARAAAPPIDGLDSARVQPLRTVEDAQAVVDLSEGAQNAVVIGGGFIGIEAAEAFAKRGIQTTIVEGSSHVMPPLDIEMANLTAGALQSIGVRVIAGVKVEKIHHQPAHDLLILSNGEALEAQVIVLSAGVVPNTEPFAAAGIKTDARGYIEIDCHGRTNLPDVYAVGDAVSQKTAITDQCRPVALAGPTNRAGRLVADFIFDPEHARELPEPLSTSIFRVGKMTVAMTGANRAELEAAKIDYTTVHTHPLSHVSVISGAEPMQLMMHFENRTGRILGAQGVGGQGVDKRIDAIAASLRGGLTAPDLIDLDLAYSPPYNSPKDPVNLLGYLADNILSGRLELWYAQDIEALPADAFILDVRGEPEFRGGHLRGATCIPLSELREKIADVRTKTAGKTVYVCDDTGVTAWIASQILRSNDLNAKVLSGGVNTAFAYHLENPGAVLEM